MFEKFLSENAESFKQRYEGTYGFYTDGSKKRLLVRLTDISNSRCGFVDENDVTYHVNPDHPDNVGFEFLPPKSAWYNTEDGAVYTQRMATRQWQRGVTSKTLEIYLLVAKIGLAPVRVGFRILSSLYEKALPPKTAFENWDHERSLAISSQFALCGGYVYLLRENIGTYSFANKKFKIKLNEPTLWRTEINDAITAIGSSAEIS